MWISDGGRIRKDLRRSCETSQWIELRGLWVIDMLPIYYGDCEWCVRVCVLRRDAPRGLVCALLHVPASVRLAFRWLNRCSRADFVFLNCYRI